MDKQDQPPSILVWLSDMAGCMLMLIMLLIVAIAVIFAVQWLLHRITLQSSGIPTPARLYIASMLPIISAPISLGLLIHSIRTGQWKQE